MGITIEIQGTKQLIDKINKIEAILNSNELKEYLAQKMLDVVNRTSSERLTYNEDYIAHNKTRIEQDYIMIYNDVQNSQGAYYSLIVEYGSGMYAEKGHIGSTNSFINSGYVWWLVPVEEGSTLAREAFEVIDLPATDTFGGGSFYKVFGQTPKHIYEDSAEIIQRNLSRWVNKFIKEELGDK